MTIPTWSRMLALTSALMLVPALGFVTSPSPAVAQAQAQPAPSQRAAKPADKPAATKGQSSKADGTASAAGKGGQTILVLVNDEPISGYDVEQRINLLLLSSGTVNERLKAKLQDPNINEKFKQYAMARNPNIRSQEDVKALQQQFVLQLRQQAVAEARPTQRKAALEEIIDERIKLQAAKKLNITVSDADVSSAVLEIAKKNDKNEKEFAAMLAGMGVDIDTMKARFRAGIAWRDVVRRQYGHQISIGQQDIERAVATATAGSAGGTLTDLSLVKITLPFPAKSDEKSRAAKFAEAETVRQKFTSCRAAEVLAKGVTGAQYANLGVKEAAAFPEPLRSVLVNAKAGEMVPPSIAAGGVELYAVCDRQQRTVAESKREEAAQQLQAQEFELLARKALKNLRQDAVIDYRQ